MGEGGMVMGLWGLEWIVEYCGDRGEFVREDLFIEWGDDLGGV